MNRGTRVAFGLLPALACAGCVGWQSMLDPHGSPALGLDLLMKFIMIVCAVVWVLVVAVLLVALARRKPRAEPLTLDLRTQERMRIVVAGSVAATVVVISVFTLASYAATRMLSVASDDELMIRVRGFQWWWDITYMAARPEESFKTANEIHIPINRPVRIQLEAADVIHSFWVPSLAGKQDLIPGRNNNIRFSAERAGIYRGQCAEFCGLQHARMAMIVVAHEPDAFEAWRQSQLKSETDPAGAEVQAGRQLFVSKACGACHTVRGTAAAGTTGPDLTHVGSRRTIAAGVFETTRGSLAAWIADPQAIKPGNNMPMVPLTADELHAVSAYMAGLK
jgi:cytochrome c oxidase subunit II